MKCPSMRCSRMSSGALDAWIFPALWYPSLPFGSRETATDDCSPSPV
ncbi:MAG: hypothetical protein Q7R30_03515 [Acidobacteriota bacterium]|nr:hypothetical protein [Acidobacteriota bacterium]